MVATDTTTSAPYGARSSASSVPACSAKRTPWSTVMSRAMARSSAIGTSGRSTSWAPIRVLYLPTASTTGKTLTGSVPVRKCGDAC